jgi:taurine dioxygenase
MTFKAKEKLRPIPERNTRYETFALSPLTPQFGAEIRGIDLSVPLSDSQDAEVRRAFNDWGVLAFRDQTLTHEQHKDFGRRFGRLHTHPLLRGAKMKHPEILPVITNADSPYTAGEGWHSDVTCDPIPPLGSMLYITETPGDGGGDTLFADMYQAYELLSEPMQKFLEGLRAVHDGGQSYVGTYGADAPEGGHPRSEHPVITRHPETGRKVLYVNSGFTSHIAGLSRVESRALLDMLFRLIESTPRIQCRVHWQPGTLTFWDNRCVQHHAVWDYYPRSRRGGRVSILGDDPPSL